MAITYSAGTGTIITSPIVYEVLGSQSGAASDEVILATAAVTPSTHANYGGNVGTGVDGWGPGDTYIGRLIALRAGDSDEEVKMIIDETDNGATITLQVSDDWTSAPVSTDRIDVAYTGDDIENGGAGGGIDYGRKTSSWLLTKDFTIGNGTDFAFFMLGPAETLEIAQEYMSIVNNGFFQCGYLFGGIPVNGAYVSIVDETAAGNVYWTNVSGSYMRLFDTDLKYNLHNIGVDWQAGSDIIVEDMKNFNFSYNCGLYAGSYTNIKWTGTQATDEYVRIAEETIINTFKLITTLGFHTEDADVSAEDLIVRDVIFIDNADNITINSNKSWYAINPVWTSITYNDALFNWLTTTANYIYDQRSIDAVVQEADGTLLADALVIVYEGTILGDLVVEEVTDVNGEAGSAFTYLYHETNSATTTYGAHALRVDKWLYFPFVATQESDEFFDSVIVLNDDDDIVQTTQATALSEGAGITWNDETNPSSIIEFDGGGGTLAVGNTVTAAPSGADGIVTQFLEGDSTAGVVHLKTRDANAFTNADTLSNGAGWTADYVNDSEQEFSIWIDGNDLTLQKIYDYLAALTSETTLSATGELIHEWGRDSQGRAVYATGVSFFTERSYGKGVFVVDYSAGALDYFTDDAGVTYTPPASLTITIHVQDKDLVDIVGAQVGIYDTATREEIMNLDTDGDGDASVGYTGPPISIEIRVRKSSPGDTRYVFFSTLGAIGAIDFNFTVTLQEDINA